MLRLMITIMMIMVKLMLFLMKLMLFIITSGTVHGVLQQLLGVAWVSPAPQEVDDVPGRLGQGDP